MIAASNFASAAFAASVPTKMQGVWGKNGRCDRLSDRLKITAHRAGWGNGPFEPVYFDPDEPEPAIHYDEEGVVSNFVMGPGPNVLIFHPQGFHMPGSETYLKCGRKMVRVRLPRR